MNRQTRRSYPVTQVLGNTILIAIPVAVIFIVASIISLNAMRLENDRAVENTVNIYQNELGHRMNAVSHFIQWTVIHDPILDDFSQDKHMGDYAQAAEALRSRVSDMQYSTGNEFCYFFHNVDNALFTNVSPLFYEYALYKDIKEGITKDIETGNIFDGSSWKYRNYGGMECLCYGVTYNGYTLISVININDLILPLTSMNLGKAGSIHLLERNGAEFYETGGIPTGLKSIFYNKLDFPADDSSLPYSLIIYCDLLNIHGRIFFLQFIVLLIALALCFILGSYILLTYKKVILPIKLFSDRLASIDSLEDGSDPSVLELTDGNIQELNLINDQFKNLIHEITRLRIDIYESELQKDKFRIHFLKQQIKPHFYLNCLTTIDSMLAIGDSKAAGMMLQFTSRYLRYLFQADKDFVAIHDELSHIQDYMDIQKLRLAQEIDYNCEIAQEHSSVSIPPLLLITFAENIIKHAQPAEGGLKIELKCSLISCKSQSDRDGFESNEYFRIYLTDNGQGFPVEVIDRINSGESLTMEGEHIGITNCIRRMRLLYGNACALHLENIGTGGARVILDIPYSFI